MLDRLKRKTEKRSVQAWKLQLFRLVLCFCGCLVAAQPRAQSAMATNYLVWRTNSNSVDAELEGWPIQKVLELVAAQTRWQVMVEPGIERSVTAKFRDLKPGEALRKLLGDLSFVMLPSTNGTGKIYVFRTSVQTATNLVVPLPPSPRPRLIPDELLVRLRPDATNSAQEFAAKYGAKVIGRIDELNLYRLKFPDENAARTARSAIQAEQALDTVDSNYATPRPTYPVTLAPEQVLANIALRPAQSENNVLVALLDTAVQSERIPIADFLLPTVPVAGPSQVESDWPSHGSSMAATIICSLQRLSNGVSETPVRILPVDIYGPNDSTTTFDIAQGIIAAVNAGASVINLSLGGTGDSPLLHNLIRSARERGVIFVAAAGNEPTTTPTFPAAYPEVIAVTAISPTGEIAHYANRGDFVDVAAPGVSLVPFGGRLYLVTGTSAATAHVSAIAAGLLANATKDPVTVESLIRQNLALGVLTPGR